MQSGGAIGKIPSGAPSSASQPRLEFGDELSSAKGLFSRKASLEDAASARSISYHDPRSKTRDNQVTIPSQRHLDGPRLPSRLPCRTLLASGLLPAARRPVGHLVDDRADSAGRASRRLTP